MIIAIPESQAMLMSLEHWLLNVILIVSPSSPSSICLISAPALVALSRCFSSITISFLSSILALLSKQQPVCRYTKQPAQPHKIRQARINFPRDPFADRFPFRPDPLRDLFLCQPGCKPQAPQPFMKRTLQIPFPVSHGHHLLPGLLLQRHLCCNKEVSG